MEGEGEGEVEVELEVDHLVLWVKELQIAILLFVTEAVEEPEFLALEGVVVEVGLYLIE